MDDKDSGIYLDESLEINMSGYAIEEYVRYLEDGMYINVDVISDISDDMRYYYDKIYIW